MQRHDELAKKSESFKRLRPGAADVDSNAMRREGSAESSSESAVDPSELLRKADWKTLQFQLLDYASFKVGRLYWRTGNQVLPRGLSAEDLVVDSIQKTFEGSRKWNPGTHPDLLGFLKSVIDSDVYHLVHSEEHRLRSGTPADEILEARGANRGDSEDDLSRNAHHLDPEEALIGGAGNGVGGGDESFENYFQSLLAEFGDDPEVMQVLLSYADQSKRGDSIKPSTVADESGLDIETVRNAVKRLRRKIRKGPGSSFQ